MEYEIKTGDIVLSKAGRDCGRYFVVLKTEENFAFVSDGDLRKVDSPKRKKFKHLINTDKSSEFILNKLKGDEKITNTELRREIQEFCEKNDF